MTDLLTAARQALPGLTWTPVDSERIGWPAVRAELKAFGFYHSAQIDLADDDSALATITTERYPKACDTADEAAQWLRAQVTARRDALDAALGEPQHLGTSASDWCGMWDIARARADAAEAKLKVLVASWPAHYHRQGCPWGAGNCGADAANAARAEARRLLEVKDA